jgi:DNA-binding transcriptional regulator/RsmH inhibitor MraZ
MLQLKISDLKLDSAHRIHLPSSSHLTNEEVVVGRLQDSILIFKKEEYEAFIKKIDGFPVPGPLVVRRARRSFCPRFFPERIDSQGRVLINRKITEN